MDIQIGQNGRGVLPEKIALDGKAAPRPPQGKPVIEGAGVRVTEAYTGDLRKLMGLLASEQDRLSQASEHGKISARIDALAGRSKMRFELLKLAIKSLEEAVKRYRLTDAELKQLREKKRQLEQKAAEMQKVLRELMAARAKALAAGDGTRVSELDKKIGDLQKQYANLTKELSGLTSLISKNESLLPALEAAVKECEKAVKSATDKLSAEQRGVVAAALKGVAPTPPQAVQSALEDAAEKKDEDSVRLNLPRDIIDAVDRFFAQRSQQAVEAALREFAAGKKDFV